MAECRRHSLPGDWRFVLQTADGESRIEVEDVEPAVQGERLELLAVVRGLEAIDGPARVTLRTPSSYVSRGIHYGLEDWRLSDWQWENHGAMVPVKDGDLWRRLDRAMQVHQVECKLQRRLDGKSEVGSRKAEGGEEKAEFGRRKAETESHTLVTVRKPRTKKIVRRDRRRAAPWFARVLRGGVSGAALFLAQMGTNLLPKPWLD
jgi:ribonuclease HI